MRRSITVLDDLNKLLLTVRGNMMSGMKVDIDYTTAMNMFLEIGLNRFLEGQLNQKEVKIILNRLNDENLKDEAKLDELTEIINKEVIKYVRNQAVHER